ncbi:MAG TPA: tripartite tricarboxylate transporter substrate binding protein [Burkholderiales bacterium]|nr:tripartite tricarboxylate transporter substrate binding protein [Burkholderiales bacterium]
MVRLFSGGARALAIAATALACAAAHAGEAYPSKPIRFIIPYAPGGTTDIIARLVGQKLTEDLGQQVIVDIRAGAGSMIGTELAAKSPPDGYTMLLSNIGLAFNETLYPKRTYDALRDLSPISLVGVTPNAFVVHPSVPANTMKDFLAFAKARSGQLSYASGGIGSSSHLSMELLQSLTGIKFNHVPYKGAGPALIDVAAGNVPFQLNSMPAVMNHVHSGRLRALAVSSAKRSQAVPDLPTIAESGVPGYDYVTWYGMLVPAHTPAAIISRLNAAVQKALGSKDVREKLGAQGVEVQGSTPDAFGKLVKTDVEKWRKIINTAKIKAE